VPRILTRSRSRGTGTDIIIPPPSGSTLLRAGYLGQFEGRVGQGPGGDTAAPIWSLCGFNPHQLSTAQVNAAIATAIEKDIQLLCITPGAPGTYGGNNSEGFDIVRYRNNVTALAANPIFSAAVESGRILCYIGDEPQHARWTVNGQATFTPTMVRDAARWHKLTWPNCYTFIRITAFRLLEGWGGFGPPGTGYDALDYAWMQYAGNEARPGMTVPEALDGDRVHGDALDMGIAFSLNLWAGGLHVTTDGIDACWDYLNNGSSSGVVVGAIVGSSGLTRGQQLTCAQFNALPNPRPTLMASPEWIRRVTTRAIADTKIPFLSYWTFAGSLEPWAVPYQQRNDSVSAYDDAITRGATRSIYEGLRPRKVYP
jgi:hypothetical protein